MFDFEKCKEVNIGFLTVNEAKAMVESSDMSLIEHSHHPLLLGRKALLKVNTNIGVSDENALVDELEKLEKLCSLSYRPDSMMDHTYVTLEKPLWKYMVEIFDGPIGTLPHYCVYKKGTGIDAIHFLETIDEMGASGVNFMTLHPTATYDLFCMAQESRSIPTTSRGGSLILQDIKINRRHDNVVVDYFDDILKLFRKYHMTLSIGTTFRPARIDEALDSVQLKEIKEQKKYIEAAKIAGVNVIMEGVGHLGLADIEKYCQLIEGHHTPLMPLGPIITDATIGFDHVTSAIGATIIAMVGNVATINSVTREEHTGGVPTIDSIIEGLKAARVCAHSINLLRFKKYGEIDKAIADHRALSRTCAIKGGIFDEVTSVSTSDGCSRCRYECPLNILR